MTARVALLGHPVAHSRSPRMMRAAFDALCLDATYTTIDVLPEGLFEAVTRLRAPDARGANVTIPHKIRVCAMLDGLDPAAAAIGAVNTIARDGDSLVGHNTDAHGLARALAEASVSLDGARVVILGAGGAARAAVVGCALAHAAHITVLARDASRAREASALSAINNTPSAADALGARDALAHADVIVQATPCGMLGGPPSRALLDHLDLDACAPTTAAIDMVYAPVETDFLRACARRNLRTLDGLGMLAHQGALALELWFDVTAPVRVMRAALNG